MENVQNVPAVVDTTHGFNLISVSKFTVFLSWQIFSNILAFENTILASLQLKRALEFGVVKLM